MTDEMSNELYYSQFGVEDIEPKFKVGDVVNTANDSRPYVIKEAIITGSRLTDRIIYEMAPFDDDDQIYQFEESVLEFQYHDDNWDFYLNEAVRNGLPPWRGELYNSYKLCSSPDDLDNFNELFIKYDDDTLPPERMAHILQGHSVYSRINNLIHYDGNPKKHENRKQVMEALKINNGELDKLYYSVRNKILSMNRTDTTPGYTNKYDKIESGFTKQEYQLVQEIDKLDKDDHYPVDMTNLQIMDAIREAYKNTEKSGKCKRQKGQENDGSLPAPVNGKKLYLGRSRKYDLIIEFWYNFDLNIIESAYPRKNKWFQEI